MKNIYKRIILCGILSALALISFIIEGLFPPLFIPGVRLGISNIFILLALIILNRKYAFITLIIKTVLGSVFSGNFSALMYSLPSGILALTVESVLIVFYKKLSIVSISTIGAVINSLMQNVIFCLATGLYGYLAFMPYLSIISFFTGLFVGITIYYIIKILPLTVLKNFIQS